MRWLLFVARVAFICNLFYLVCLLIRHTHFTVPRGFDELVIIAGWIMSVVVNFLFVVSLAILTVQKKRTLVPLYLAIFNSSLFAFQIAYYLISII